MGGCGVDGAPLMLDQTHGFKDVVEHFHPPKAFMCVRVCVCVCVCDVKPPRVFLLPVMFKPFNCTLWLTQLVAT